jgi:hypothetical protein
MTSGGPGALLVRVLTLALIVASVHIVVATRGAQASTHGNTDMFEANSSGQYVTSTWFLNSTVLLSQRYGCSTVSYELDPAPSWCPFGYNWWHQGLDLPMSSPITVYSAVHGSVAAFATSCLTSGCALGYLAIRTDGGNVVYLLHGTPYYPFGGTGGSVYVGAPVNIGDKVYTTGSNGHSTGIHLHFEVHQSVVGALTCTSCPGDDVNPEGWLYRPPASYGQQLTSWSAGDLGVFAQNGGSASAMYSSYGNSTGAWTGSWVFRDVPYGGGVPEYLATDPVVLSQSPNEWDAFAILQGGDLGWWSYANAQCTWQLVPHPPSVPLMSKLTAVARYPGQLDVFALGTDGNIYHWYANDSGTPGCTTYTTHDWQADSNSSSGFYTGPSFVTEMVAVSSDDNNIFLVARDNVSYVWWTHLDNSVWHPWINIGGPVGNSVGNGIAAVAWRTSDPASGTLTRELNVFARSPDPRIGGPHSDLFNGRYTCTTLDDSCPSGWSGWLVDVSTHGAFVPSGQLVAVSWAPYRIDLFVRDQHYDSSDGWLWHNAYVANPLTGSLGWIGYGGQTFYPPNNYMEASHLAVVALGYGNIDIVAQLTTDRSTYAYWHLCYCSNTWSSLPSGP